MPGLDASNSIQLTTPRPSPPVYDGPTFDIGTIEEILDALRKIRDEDNAMGEEQSKQRYRKKRRRKRGPAPPMSALAHFQYSELPSICREKPQAGPEEIIVALDYRWRKLQPEIKHKFEQDAARDLDRYWKQALWYLPKKVGGSMRKFKRRKREDAPKHPLNPFLFFARENRPRIKAENKDKTTPEIARLLGQAWRALTPEQLAVYHKMTKLDMERYKREMEEYLNENNYKSSAKPPEALPKRHPLAPRGPISAYLFFISALRLKAKTQYPKMSFKDIAVMLGNKWKALGPRERRIFDVLALADRKRYHEEKEKWTSKLDSTLAQNTGRQDNEQEPAQAVAPEAVSSSDAAVRREAASGATGIAMEWPVQVGSGLLKTGLDPATMELTDPMTMMNSWSRGGGGVVPANVASGIILRENTQYNPSVEVQQWSNDDVVRFICCIGMPQYQHIFKASGITGKEFLGLDSSELHQKCAIDSHQDRDSIIASITHLLDA